MNASAFVGRSSRSNFARHEEDSVYKACRAEAGTPRCHKHNIVAPPAVMTIGVDAFVTIAHRDGGPVAIAIQIDIPGETLERYDEAVEFAGFLPGGPLP